MATTVEQNSSRDIFALQQKILEENVKKYATEGERRSKLAMKALEGQTKNLSERGEKYYEMLTNTVKASEKAQGKQLEYSTQRISMIKDAISSASDLNEKDRQLLENQVATVQKVFAQNQSNTSTLLTKVDSFLEENSVDITSVVAGLTSNNPAIMFAVKWIGDSIKRKKEEEKAARQAIDEASEIDTSNMERGSSGPSPIQEELVKVNEKLAANNASDDGQSPVEELVKANEKLAVIAGKDADGPSPAGDELVKVNENLESANNTNEQWRAEEEANSFRAEEARREDTRAREDQLDALETIANKDFSANVEVEGGDGGGCGLLGMFSPKAL